MRKVIYTLIMAILMVTAVSAETGGSLTVGLYSDIDHSSLGVSGVLFPNNYQKGGLSLGMEFGLHLIERFLYENEPMQYQIYPVSSSDTDYVWFYNKVYRDYLFIPLGLTVRYDLRDAGKLNILRPSLSLGVGGVLSSYQKSYRQMQNWYNNPPPSPSSIPDDQYFVDKGGESIGSFSFYLKPGITLYWNRIYLGYEHYFGAEYMRHSINIGYIFRL